MAQLEAFTRRVNTANPRFQMALEHTGGQNKKLIVLDIEAWISDGKVAHCFYRKPTAKDYVLPTNSAHSRGTKASYIQSECVRIRMRCSKQQFAWVLSREVSRAIIERRASQMVHWFALLQGVTTVSWSSASKWLGGNATFAGLEMVERQLRVPGGVGHQGTMLPFGLKPQQKSLRIDLQKAAVSNGLPVALREKAGVNMKQKMCRSIINPLEYRKISAICPVIFPEEDMENSQWLAKDVVYQVRCSICKKCYTGETGMPFHKRMYHHWYGLCRKCSEDSALTQHFIDHHPEQGLSLELVGLVKTNGYVVRKITEAVRQQATERVESTINRRREQVNVVGPNVS